MPAGLRALSCTADRMRRTARRLVAPLGVLSYHRVAEPAFDPWSLSVSAANFADQLHVFGERGRFVHLNETVGVGRWRPRRTERFAVTFDDGYVDNLIDALPILEQHDVPATVFVTTGFLDREAFWWDVLDEAVLDGSRDLGDLVAAGRACGLLVCADGGASRAAIQAELHASLAQRSPSDVEPLVAQLLAATAIAPPAPQGRPLTTAELVQMAAHPLISIGVHTVHHARLPNAGVERARRELVEARDALDRLIGPAHRAVAYPHGDVDASIAALTRSLGFSCAVTTDHRWVRPRDDRMLLPRLTVTNQTGDRMYAQLHPPRAS
jgi:peptidoglycan/xylan/chitin deacetylase (PgdA/CDA1 family)